MTTVMRPVRRTSAFTQTDRSWETWDELGTVESDNMTPTGGISAFTDLGIFRARNSVLAGISSSTNYAAFSRSAMIGMAKAVRFRAAI